MVESITIHWKDVIRLVFNYIDVMYVTNDEVAELQALIVQVTGVKIVAQGTLSPININYFIFYVIFLPGAQNILRKYRR